MVALFFVLRVVLGFQVTLVFNFKFERESLWKRRRPSPSLASHPLWRVPLVFPLLPPVSRASLGCLRLCVKYIYMYISLKKNIFFLREVNDKHYQGPSPRA